VIALSTTTYALDGHIVIKELPKSNLPSFARRLTRTATLDGNSSINDGGYSDSDSTFIVKTNQTDIADNLETLIKNYPLMILTSKQGAFLGAMSSLSTRSYPIEFTFLVKERLSA